MTRPADDLVEGRARRTRAVATVGVMLALVAGLPIAYAWLSDDGEPGAVPTGGLPPPGARPEEQQGRGILPAPDLHGRLVYTTFETRGFPDRQQRIWVLDLATGVVSEGPLVPAVEELWVTDPERGWLVLVADDAGAQGVGYLLTTLTPNADPVELARGDLLSLSTDGTELLVGRTEPTRQSAPGCQGHRYTLHRVSIDSGAQSTVVEGRLACGNLVSAAAHDGSVTMSFVRHGRAEVRGLWPGELGVLFEDLAITSISPGGTHLFVDPEGGVLKGLGVWPRTPTGPLLVWPRAGTPRPLVTGSRLFSQRVVVWSPDGGHVVVNGIVGGERGMWLVYVPAGTVEPLLPPNSFPLRSAFSGASFDDGGTVFAGSPGTIVAATDAGVFPVVLPPDAPSPVGPVAWLP